MPKKIALFLPVLYALAGGYLWYQYGVETTGVILWVVLIPLLIPIYYWLISDESLGLMFNLHLWTTGIGILMLFYILLPEDSRDTTTELIIELLLMGLGTFCCAFGVFSLLYMVVRKLLVG